MSLIAAALDRAEAVADPYPHLVVDRALPAGIARTILDEMPPIEVLAQDRPLGSNRRFYLPTERALAEPRISKAWKDAMRAVNDGSQQLLDWVTGNLGHQLLATYPDFEARFGPLDALKAVPRALAKRRSNEVGIDAQIVVNSPALSDGTSVRGPHLDHPDKLISALLYLRAEGDNSSGAELELFEALSDQPAFDERNDLSRKSVRRVRTYPYRHNLLVFSINMPRSLHGVSPRNRTLQPRYHIHVVGELAEPLFEIRRNASDGLRQESLERMQQGT